MHDGSIGSEEVWKWSMVRYDVILMVKEGNVAGMELFCALLGIFGVSHVFSHMKEVVKGYGGHIAAGLEFVRF